MYKRETFFSINNISIRGKTCSSSQVVTKLLDSLLWEEAHNYEENTIDNCAYARQWLILRFGPPIKDVNQTPIPRARSGHAQEVEGEEIIPAGTLNRVWRQMRQKCFLDSIFTFLRYKNPNRSSSNLIETVFKWKEKMHFKTITFALWSKQA